LLGVADELHGAVVGENQFELDIGGVGLVGRNRDVAPKDAGLHDVPLGCHVHLARTLAGEIAADSDDALDFGGCVDGGVDAALFAILKGDDFLGLAEVGAARQFAKNENVEALDEFLLQRRGVGRLAKRS